MRLRFLSFCAALAVASFAAAQWDVKKIGHGGESTVASDGEGNVYVTCHLPSDLYISRDWGNTFVRSFLFKDSLGDMFVLARPHGMVNVTTIRTQIDGIASWYSTDGGRTMQQGKSLMGPLDREWLVADTSGNLFMDFSNGYIGGPKSKGLFLARSWNDGQSFPHAVRVDREQAGSYAVDPYIAISEPLPPTPLPSAARRMRGASFAQRLYAMWATSKDYETIENFKLAYSDDSGRTFSNPQTLADFPKVVDGEKVDTQERWMLGAMVAAGPKKLLLVYPEYKHVNVDGKSYLAFLLYYRASEDGGETFTPSRSALSQDEIVSAVRTYEQNHADKKDGGHYIQTLPWLCADKDQRIFLAFTDNRDGQTRLGKATLNRWHVRCATCFVPKNGFVWSEEVSHEYDSKRTPMDFLSCTADSKQLYISWTENPGSTADWPNGGFMLFTGDLYVGRKKLAE